MKKTEKIISASLITAICGFFCISDANSAAVTARNQRKTSAASRMPTMAMRTNAQTTTSDDTETSETTETSESIETTETPDITITDKTSEFDEILGTSVSSAVDVGSNTLAEQIRAQRAALDALDATTATTQQMQSALSTGQNACDANLRACMAEKCGSDFTKCAGDTDTLFGTKLDACRRNLPCSGEEYQLFTTQIKADRDLNTKLSLYNKTIAITTVSLANAAHILTNDWARLQATTR